LEKIKDMQLKKITHQLEIMCAIKTVDFSGMWSYGIQFLNNWQLGKLPTSHSQKMITSKNMLQLVFV